MTSKEFTFSGTKITRDPGIPYASRRRDVTVHMRKHIVEGEKIEGGIEVDGREQKVADAVANSSTVLHSRMRRRKEKEKE